MHYSITVPVAKDVFAVAAVAALPRAVLVAVARDTARVARLRPRPRADSVAKIVLLALPASPHLGVEGSNDALCKKKVLTFHHF